MASLNRIELRELASRKMFDHIFNLGNPHVCISDIRKEIRIESSKATYIYCGKQYEIAL